MQKFSRGIVFGVFDGLHPGHQYFLAEAAKQCDEFTVVVTLDDVVLHFKNRLPKFSLAERINALTSFTASLNKKITVVPGDGVSEMGNWPVLKKYQPDVVFVGYDQELIAGEMVKLNIPTILIPAYYPEKYKSSLIQKLD